MSTTVVWVLVIQILSTQQIMGLPEPTEEKCLSDLGKFRAGVHNVVKMPDGLVVPVHRALGCVTMAEFEARIAGRI